MADDKLLEFLLEIGKLKTIKRSGWLRCGIECPESVADHTFRTAVMAMFYGELLGLDIEKLLKMALLHDMPEVLTGDITPMDNVAPDEKREKETQAIQKLMSNLTNRDEYISLWNEFEHQQTDEAILVKNIDKLEMALQAVEYQKKFPDINLDEFIRDAGKKIEIPVVHDMFEKIKREFSED